ncbi:2,3-bisphosphoglycerate-independent phosphoglycerate mutase [Acanthopleuribacter pedis]|uniref:2,3-bisphosphoglycerate-independent phosphoglycerate mutase n=1 Tax=Acanthopleuribacter pedis TaxID=442870 RepID=A0A8J7U6W3_9BACT|nr:2,3-bisphosphoglycerate-independent phosphoglycerate mutase [Acanthopleuribacter pedis]MBO1323192.1 2,3-bisphosphoglycerate-independent phosphoglycerate mutase [Acanthopleuribacter pedis]
MAQGINGPLVMVVLDGVGEVDRSLGNAERLAHMPFWHALKRTERFTTLRAHGTAVGLPSDGDMGNSEVGHNALGSGQIYDQGAKLVNDAIESGRIFAGETWNTAVRRVKEHKSTLHLIGLLSDGNVHSHIKHVFAMLDKAAKEGVTRARLHVLLDGRDVGGTTAQIYLQQLEDFLAERNKEGNDYRIASGGGRMVLTMDRYEADWSMVQRGWDHHVHGKGRVFPSALKALETFREETPGMIDQDLPGFVIGDESGPVGAINDGDSVFFFNFRGDRAIEISRAFDEGDDFTHIDRGTKPDVFYAGMMQYDGDLPSPNHYLVGPPNIKHTLTEFLVPEKVTQFAISETQKYGHVTYFWNGNRSGKVDATIETYQEIPSDTIPFDQRPWMKAAEITDALTAAIQSGQHRFLRVNYANGDMVGHTGNLDAAITGMSCLDLELRRLLTAVKKAGGVALITADHGNCDEMYEFDKKGQPVKDEDGHFKPKTSHTLSRVPFVLYDPSKQVKGELAQSKSLGIGQVAATVVEILGYSAPKQWLPSLLH